MQCDAVRCSALQIVAVSGCMYVQSAALVFYSVLMGMLQCAAVCCSLLQCRLQCRLQCATVGCSVWAYVCSRNVLQSAEYGVLLIASPAATVTHIATHAATQNAKHCNTHGNTLQVTTSH